MSPIHGKVPPSGREAAAGGLLHHKDTNGISSSSPGFSALQARRKCRLESAVAWIVQKFGYECTGFLTITFPDNVVDWDEAQRRFHSFEINVLSQYAKEWVLVVQCQQRGALHYHLVVGLERDIRTGTNLSAIKDRKLPRWLRYSKSNVSENLRGYWESICQAAAGRVRVDGQFKQVRKGYQLGRVELLPLIKEPLAVARYIAAYLKPGSDMPKEYKGKRKLRFSRGISCWLSANFQINTFGSYLWRKKLETVALDFGLERYEDLGEVFGPRWFDVLRDCVRLCPLKIEKEDWQKNIGDRLFKWRLETFWIEAQRDKDKAEWREYTSAKRRAVERWEENLREVEKCGVCAPDYFQPPVEWQMQLPLMKEKWPLNHENDSNNGGVSDPF